MKFTTTLISLATAALLSAACPGASGSSGGAGAAYGKTWQGVSLMKTADRVLAVITNEDENFVVSHSIGQDGKLVRRSSSSQSVQR